MAQRDVRVGNITGVSGKVNVAGGNLYEGYSAEQVSVLLTQITSTFQSKPFDGRCPYKGLDVFEEEDAELFFGRENLIEDLVSRVKVSRTVFITGPSGSGKSSLVRAGLIHALKRGAISDLQSERWLYETMKPGRDPIGELARVASSLAGTLSAGEDTRTKALSDATVLAQWCEIALKDSREKRTVLFIDQFEECFTQISKEEERVALLNLLTHAATVENGRVIVLFAMRSDFVSNCATYPKLNALLNQQFMQIGAMQPDELVNAIAQPALRVGLRIDPDLIAQIINDMQGEPGTLPLMQFALKDLFDSEQAKGGGIALTLNEYLQRGGIRKSLERHADDSFAKLNKNEQELARSIFSGLIEIGRGTQDTRRTALFDELIPASAKAADIEAIIRKLADARLITTDEQAGKDTVTISHEKLIDAWPWLKKLVNENRDAIALQNEMASDAKEWDDQERDPSYLYTGARLASAREQLVAKKLVLSGLAPTFVDASIAAEDAERRQEEARRQKELDDALKLADAEAHRAEEQTLSATKLRQRALYLTVALAIALIAVGGAVFFGFQANEQARIASLRLLAAQAQSASLEGNLNLALLLSLETTKVAKQRNGSDALTVDTFWDSIAKSGGLFLGFPTAPADLAVFSPNSQWLVTNCYDATQSCGDVIARLWNVAASNPVTAPLEFRGKGAILHIANIAINRHWLVTVDDGGRALLWDLTTKDPAIGTSILFDQAIDVRATSPDQGWLVSSSDDQVTRLWDLAISTSPTPLLLDDGTNSVRTATVSPDSHWLVIGYNDSIVRLWDLDKLNQSAKPISLPIGPDNIIGLSPDATWLVTSNSGDFNDNQAHLWNLKLATTGSLITPYILTGYVESTTRVSFSLDKHWLVTGSPDGFARLWDLSKTNPSTASILLAGGGGHINIAIISPNNHWLFTVGGDGGDNNARLWDLTVDNPANSPLILDNYGSIDTAAISPDSKWLVTSGSRWESPTRLWMLKRNDMIADDEVNYACQIVGRNLTRIEYAQYINPNPWVYDTVYAKNPTCKDFQIEVTPTSTPTP
jgi:WD40 repeat protein/energy-coupling factor transporter ATP-binding protein EcfA2